MKLEKQVSSFADDPKLPCEAALKKMYKLLEKYVYFSRACLFHRIEHSRPIEEFQLSFLCGEGQIIYYNFLGLNCRPHIFYYHRLLENYYYVNLICYFIFCL